MVLPNLDNQGTSEEASGVPRALLVNGMISESIFLHFVEEQRMMYMEIAKTSYKDRKVNQSFDGRI